MRQAVGSGPFDGAHEPPALTTDELDLVESRALLVLPRPAVSAGLKVVRVSPPPRTPHGAPRVIICDYNALLHSVTGLLRMSGLAVFQAYDGEAARQLCQYMPEIDLLILNTEGTGMDTAGLIRDVRAIHPGLPVLHIGRAPLPDMPANVPHLSEGFTPGELLTTVDELIQGQIEAERPS